MVGLIALPPDSCRRVNELLLEWPWWKREAKSGHISLVDARLIDGLLGLAQDLVLHCGSLEPSDHESREGSISIDGNPHHVGFKNRRFLKVGNNCGLAQVEEGVDAVDYDVPGGKSESRDLRWIDSHSFPGFLVDHASVESINSEDRGARAVIARRAIKPIGRASGDHLAELHIGTRVVKHLVEDRLGEGVEVGEHLLVEDRGDAALFSQDRNRYGPVFLGHLG